MVKEKKRVALISVFAAIFLTGFKLVIGILTGSLGILSEALHSGLDLVAAVITYFSVRISDKPADKEHGFGHGKIEKILNESGQDSVHGFPCKVGRKWQYVV